MTNREYIESLTDEDLADFLSKGIADCGSCPIDDYCHYVVDFTKSLCYHNWLRWLKDEHKGEKE